MASWPRTSRPSLSSITASGSNKAVMPLTSPAFSLTTNCRSNSWGSEIGSFLVRSLIATLCQPARCADRPISHLGDESLHRSRESAGNIADQITPTETEHAPRTTRRTRLHLAHIESSLCQVAISEARL